MATKSNLYEVHHEWATRPNEERFLTLEDLANYTKEKMLNSYPIDCQLRDLTCNPGEDFLTLSGEGLPNSNHLSPWAYTQLCSSVRAPQRYINGLSPELATDCLNFGIKKSGLGVQILTGSSQIRALTSLSYGRIWDNHVVSSVMELFGDRWKVPSASYSAVNPKQATTLYASDRDVFIFLVNEEDDIQSGDVVLHRGIMAWNSEVGARTFGVCHFLYEFVCDNRIIWGVSEVKELVFRHTSAAPWRFGEMEGVLRSAIAGESAMDIRFVLRGAQSHVLGQSTEAVVEAVEKFGFLKPEAARAIELAEMGEAGPCDPWSLWGAVQGLTKYAQSLPFTDERVQFERKAGKILERVAV